MLSSVSPSCGVWYEMMSFEHFFQALSIFNVLHMFVGGLVGAALHSYGMKYYMADGFARCSQYIDRVRMSASPADFSSVVSRLEGVMAQSIKDPLRLDLACWLFFAPADVAFGTYRWCATRSSISSGRVGHGGVAWLPSSAEVASLARDAERGCEIIVSAEKKKGMGPTSSRDSPHDGKWWVE